jgi:hypothetical protein
LENHALYWSRKTGVAEETVTTSLRDSPDYSPRKLFPAAKISIELFYYFEVVMRPLE